MKHKLTFFNVLVAVLMLVTVVSGCAPPAAAPTTAPQAPAATEAPAAAKAITENFVTGRVLPIFSSSALTLDVQKNVVDTSSALVAIWLGNSQSVSNGTAKFNIFFGSGIGGTDYEFLAAATDHVTYDGNFCDPAHPDCASCITAGRCMPYTSPFTGN